MSISGNVIQTWGQSGRNAVYLTNQSGNNAMQVSQAGDGAFQHIGVWSNSVLFGKDEVGTGVNRLRTTASGAALSASGTNFKLLTTVSGDVVHISGQTVATSVSGNFVNTSISGNIITDTYGSTLRTGDGLVVGNQSGGIPLTTGAGLTRLGIRLRISTGSLVRIGSNVNPPYESGGFITGSGNTIIDLPINNPDNVRLFCPNIGDATVTWIGFDL